MSLQVGRKPKSKNLGLMQAVELPLFHIGYQPVFPRGAKREIRDEGGKLLYHSRHMKIWTGYFYYSYEDKPQRIPLYCMKKDVEITLKNLIKNGCKKPKAEPMTQQLPRICPDCGNEGTIVWNYAHRDLRNQNGVLEFKKDDPKIIFSYNHSKTYPKKCYLGTWNYEQMQIGLKKGIDIRKMFVGYYLKEGEERHFDL